MISKSCPFENVAGKIVRNVQTYEQNRLEFGFLCCILQRFELTQSVFEAVVEQLIHLQQSVQT